MQECISARNSLLGGMQSLRPETVGGFILALERVDDVWKTDCCETTHFIEKFAARRCAAFLVSRWCRKTPGFCDLSIDMTLRAEAVEGLALALERVDDVEGRDGLPAGVLGVGDRILDDVLEEDLQHAAGLLVHQAGDALHATAARQTADRGLGDALDVVAHDLTMALGTALAWG